jgi:hypothetical protein
MMVDGAEEGQFRGPIDVLAPYTLARSSAAFFNRNHAGGTTDATTPQPHQPALQPRPHFQQPRAISKGPGAYAKRVVRRKIYGKSMGTTGKLVSCPRSRKQGAEPIELRHEP